jgi:phosphoribosylaminoimidazole carboxylase (NCAIR synthetase)
MTTESWAGLKRIFSMTNVLGRHWLTVDHSVLRGEASHKLFLYRKLSLEHRSTTHDNSLRIIYGVIATVYT